LSMLNVYFCPLLLAEDIEQHWDFGWGQSNNPYLGLQNTINIKWLNVIIKVE